MYIYIYLHPSIVESWLRSESLAAPISVNYLPGSYATSSCIISTYAIGAPYTQSRGPIGPRLPLHRFIQAVRQGFMNTSRSCI